MRERRKYERFILELPATIEVLTPGREELLNLMTGNISAGGAFFLTQTPLPKDTQVGLSLTLQSKRLEELTGSEGLIKVKGKVVRSHPTGIAISFEKGYQILSSVIS